MRPFRALIDLILPTPCAGCTTPDGPWCPTCARSLSIPRPVSRPTLHARGHPPPAYALGTYQGPARRAVLAYKERSRRELAPHFAKALATAIPPLLTPSAAPLVLVPAPSRPSAARRRGGQHMATVATHCATLLTRAGLPTTVAQALRLDPDASDSIGLDATARTANLTGRLHPVPHRKPPPTAPVLLIDDVITTGATAAACTAALASIGTPVTAVLSLTTTP